MTLKLRYKCMLVALAIAAVAGLASAQIFYIGSLPGTVPVNEPITWSPASFSLAMYAGETVNQTVQVNNAANVALNITVLVTVGASDGSAGNITVNAPSYITVPAQASADFNVTITAFDYATPSTYSVNIALSR